jgi:membrane associated rhomboid family serine protease
MVSAFSVAAVAVAVAIMVFFWVRKASMVQAIVLANLAVFILMLIAGQVQGGGFGTIADSPFLQDLAFTPIDLVDGNWPAFWKIFTSAFLHSGFLHIFGNMLILIMAGLPFEDRIGRGPFLAIYLFTAVTAVLMHSTYDFLVEGRSALAVPIVGASGAVFGILGAFATTYPHDRIPMWLFFIILPRVPVVLAAIVLMVAEGVFLFLGPASSVARAAHLGGAIGGALIGPMFKRDETKSRDPMRPGKLDLQALEALAQTPRQRSYMERLRENLDEPEARQAWVERLILSAECRTCQKPYASLKGTTARCPEGHEDRYDTR